MKLLSLCMLTLMTNVFCFAENEPKDPVFVVSYNNSAPKTGDIIEVILKATVPDGLHMYSTYNKCDIGPLKLDIIFTKDKSYALIGVPYSIGDKKSVDEVFKCELGQFDKQAEVRQKIRILSSDVKISGTIEGQWCTETTCYNFGSLIPVGFVSTLKATPGKSKQPGPKTKPTLKKPESKKTKSINPDASFLKPSDYIDFCLVGIRRILTV